MVTSKLLTRGTGNWKSLEEQKKHFKLCPQRAYSLAGKPDDNQTNRLKSEVVMAIRKKNEVAARERSELDGDGGGQLLG